TEGEVKVNKAMENALKSQVGVAN
ncbi:MAG: hypothetical protein RJB35_711, partial [Actinomycetota bacterium]